MEPAYYTVQEISTILNISPEAARRLALSLPHLRIGRSIRVRKEVIEAYQAGEVSPKLTPPTKNVLLPTGGRFLN